MAAANTFTVVFWNILLDTREDTLVPQQVERHEEIARRLQDLGKSLDVVCLCEIENSKNHGHMGERIAALTGNTPGKWTHHPSPKDHEQIGMFGKKVKNVDFELLGNKNGAIAHVGSTAVAGIHLTYRVTSTAHQRREINTMLDALSDEKNAVIMGDFNSLPWQAPRRLVESYGYTSVFEILGQEQPATSPILEYRPMTLPTWQQAILRLGDGFSADDIYIKGDLKVKDAGIFKGESDHCAVWATLEA